MVLAANHFGRFFTGQITAAGKVPPAKVTVFMHVSMVGSSSHSLCLLMFLLSTGPGYWRWSGWFGSSRCSQVDGSHSQRI